jgi:hypothetical protein
VVDFEMEISSVENKDGSVSAANVRRLLSHAFACGAFSTRAPEPSDDYKSAPLRPTHTVKAKLNHLPKSAPGPSRIDVYKARELAGRIRFENNPTTLGETWDEKRLSWMSSVSPLEVKMCLRARAEGMKAGEAKGRAERAKLEVAWRIVETLATNDPDEQIADNGMRVVDGLKTDAMRLFSQPAESGAAE